MPKRARGPSHAAIATGLAVAVLVCFAPILKNGFIESFDDNKYVLYNPNVQHGLDAASLRWALTTSTASNWHPLTWVSHTIDYALFGTNAAGHHATSLALHAASVVLLFLLLVRLTSNAWRSAIAAGLFAIHPLRVESVAWVAERKDVLGGFFFVLTLWAYARYVERPRPGRMALVAGVFALGLASKPMLVTLPFVLLLLDAWPLDRWGEGARRLLTEKAPLFAMSAASAAVTAWAARAHALRSLQEFPWSVRIGNAIVAYGAYLAKTVWPARLAVIYPHPGSPAAWKLALSAAALIAIGVAAVRERRRRPWLLVGWLWFLGMLVPVIGLVQVGQQSMADRYTYLPSIGLSLIVAWLIPEGASTTALAAAAGIALGACTWRQAALWRDSVTLFTHALAVTKDNGIAHMNLGLSLYNLGRVDDAVAHYRESVRIWPEFAAAHSNLGAALSDLGRLDEAMAETRRAIELDPADADAHNNLGSALFRAKRVDEAIVEFREAARLEPDHARAAYNLGTALASRGAWAESASTLREAVRLDPRNPAPHSNLAAALLGLGDYAEAWREVHAVRALGHEPPAGLVAQLSARMPDPVSGAPARP